MGFKTMKIAIVGAGRLATNLAPALQKGGAEVVEVWSRTCVSAETLAARLGCKATWGDVAGMTREADLYLLSIKDAALKDVVSRLHEGREEALFAHTSGSVSLSLFSEAGHQRGAVFYPLQTFSKERQVDFAHVHLFIESMCKADENLLHTLATTLTPHVHQSTSATRRRLHLAAVFACNFANHCCTLADDLLSAADLDYSVLLPLIDETVEKLHQLRPADAQTGPAVRRDENVMGMHRAMLADHPELQHLYNQLSESIIRYTHD